MFKTKILPANPDATAPDGSDVRILLSLSSGSMAHFELAAGKSSIAVAHRTVEEIWFIIAGQGEMWRCLDDQVEIVALSPGTCLTIPLGTHFQFRSIGPGPLTAIAITMPPWPGETEAVQVDGVW